MKEKFWIFWNANIWSAHERMLAHYLRKRGWVVFYLEEEVRSCQGGCWLNLYKKEMENK